MLNVNCVHIKQTDRQAASQAGRLASLHPYTQYTTVQYMNTFRHSYIHTYIHTCMPARMHTTITSHTHTHTHELHNMLNNLICFTHGQRDKRINKQIGMRRVDVKKHPGPYGPPGWRSHEVGQGAAMKSPVNTQAAGACAGQRIRPT